MFTAPATRVSNVVVAFSATLATQGLHRVTVTHYVNGEAASSTVSHVATGPDEWKWRWTVGPFSGTGEGPVCATPPLALPAGVHAVAGTVTATRRGCDRCVCAAGVSTNLAVGRLTLTCDAYLGQDRTGDPGVPYVSPSVRARAEVEPTPDGLEGVAWGYSGVCERREESAWELRLWTTNREKASPWYRGETISASAGGASAVTNFTVVKVDVKASKSCFDVEELDEGAEETNGVSLARVEDRADGSWRKETAARLVRLSVTCTPEDLPDSETVSIACGEPHTLYEKTEDGYREAESSYRAGAVGTKQFYLHGHGLSRSARDGTVAAAHASSGAFDRLVFTCHELDLDIDSDNDLHVVPDDAFEDEIENERPGKILALDGHGIATNLDYRAEIRLRMAHPEPPDGGCIRLEAETGADKIRLYGAPSGGDALPLPLEFPLGGQTGMPARLYADGAATGRVELAALLLDRDRKTNDIDRVKMLVTPTVSFAPGASSNAVVWSSLPSLGERDAYVFESLLQTQGFSHVVWYRDGTGADDTNVFSCTLENYKRIPNYGAVTIVSHGAEATHLAVYFENSVIGRQAASLWKSNESAMVIRFLNDTASSLYYVEVASSWHQANWQAGLNANNAIVIWSICYSASGTLSLTEAGGGRVRVGYRGTTDERETASVNQSLLRQMGGLEGGGRPDVDAAPPVQNGYPNVRIETGPWTTLCPAPFAQDAVFPDRVLESGEPAFGCLLLDTFLDDSIPAEDALEVVSGTGVSDIRWLRQSPDEKPYGIGFRIQKGSDVIRIRALREKIKSWGSGGGRCMDADRVAPNDTDKEWRF